MGRLSLFFFNPLWPWKWVSYWTWYEPVNQRSSQKKLLFDLRTVYSKITITIFAGAEKAKYRSPSDKVWKISLAQSIKTEPMFKLMLRFLPLLITLKYVCQSQEVFLANLILSMSRKIKYLSYTGSELVETVQLVVFTFLMLLRL